MGVGVSKIANLLKSLDSESRLSRISKSCLRQIRLRRACSKGHLGRQVQNDKIGITYIVTQSLRRGKALRRGGFLRHSLSDINLQVTTLLKQC